MANKTQDALDALNYLAGYVESPIYYGDVFDFMDEFEKTIRQALQANQPKEQSSNVARLQKIRAMGLPDSALKLVEDDYDKLMAFAETLQSPALNQPQPIRHNGVDYWPDENGWYDIECAPRDGTAVLVYTAQDKKISVADSPIDMIDGTQYWCGQNDSIIANPTNWQPLPEPPVT